MGSELRRWLLNPAESVGPRDIAAAAIVAQAFTLYILAMSVVAPTSEENWQLADPLLALAPRSTVVWVVVLAAVAMALAWSWRARPTPADLARTVRPAIAGVLVAMSVMGLLRIV